MHKYFISCHFVIDRDLQYATGDVVRYFKTYDHIITETDIRNVESEASAKTGLPCTAMCVAEIA